MPFQTFACKSRVLVCTNGCAYHHSQRFSNCTLPSKLPLTYSKLVCCYTSEIFWVVQHSSLIVTTRLILQAVVPTQFCLSDIKTGKGSGHLLVRGKSIEGSSTVKFFTGLFFLRERLRDQRRALMYAVMNLKVSQMEAYSFPEQEDCSLE